MYYRPQSTAGKVLEAVLLERVRLAERRIQCLLAALKLIWSQHGIMATIDKQYRATNKTRIFA
jgi:hypothetical protein